MDRVISEKRKKSHSYNDWWIFADAGKIEAIRYTCHVISFSREVAYWINCSNSSLSVLSIKCHTLRFEWYFEADMIQRVMICLVCRSYFTNDKRRGFRAWLTLIIIVKPDNDPPFYLLIPKNRKIQLNCNDYSLRNTDDNIERSIAYSNKIQADYRFEVASA